MTDGFCRRSSDNGGRMSTDPLMLLGQLHARVTNLESTTTDTNQTVKQIAVDLNQMKVDKAASDGQKRGILTLTRVGAFVITTIASVAAAWATVKASLPEVPHGH